MSEYFGLLQRNRNYRFLWLGSVVSQLGDWFNLLASAELITRLSDSGIAISYLVLARYLPLFLFSPLAGVLADRYNRKTLMVVTDVLRAVTVAAFLLIRSSEQLWLLYVLTVVQFVLSALFTPARSAVIANIVPVEDLVAANALDGLTWSTMLAFGAFLGGVVTAVAGSDTAFVVDAVTFLVSALFISLMQISGQSQTVTAETAGWLGFVEGFRYLQRSPFILGVSVAKAAGSLVWGAINVVEITFAEKHFPLIPNRFTQVLHIENGGAATLGLIYVLSGLGTGLGPLVLRRLLGDRPQRLMVGITAGFFLMAGGIWMLAEVPNLFLLLVATFVRTVGSGVLWVFSAALLQMLIPDQFRGRVFAFEFALLTLTQSVSTYTAGLFQDTLMLDVFQVSAVVGVFGLVVSLGWGVFHLFNLSRFNRPSAINPTL